MNRCTISEHSIDENSHLDIFFETDSHLETYEAERNKFDLLFEQKKISCRKKQPHRKIYLEYEGDISLGRGSIKILWAGHYQSVNFFLKEIDIFLVEQNILRIDARI